MACCERSWCNPHRYDPPTCGREDSQGRPIIEKHGFQPGTRQGNLELVEISWSSTITRQVTRRGEWRLRLDCSECGSSEGVRPGEDHAPWCSRFKYDWDR